MLSPRQLLPTTLAAVLLAAPVPSTLAAQEERSPRADSLIEAAREKQRDFEAYRQSRIPVQADRTDATCDSQIGRICIWYGGEGEADFPAERPEVGVARDELINVLVETAKEVPDAWVTGQLVHYLVERGDSEQAEAVARKCGIPEEWWCSALLGYVLHLRLEFIGAEEAFREALATMPPEERERWYPPRWILTAEGERELMSGSPAEARHRWELFWKLSDPLFLMQGNDRFTDHFARLVEARNFEDAGHPQDLEWGEDLEETLIRYGRIVGWSRTHSPFGVLRGGTIQDTRRVIGHHHPKSRGYLFPEEFLESPSDIPPESWITAPRESRTWYAAPYAPDFRGLETQVGRFRRGEDMFVVGAYRPAPPDPGEEGVGLPRGPNVHAALFLIPEHLEGVAEEWGNDPEGVFTLRAPPGRYVASLELIDVDARRAWRARQGVKQVPMVPGLVAVSDLMILKEGAPFPVSLEEAIPLVRPGVRVRQGEQFTVVWEVYGLDIDDPARVTIGFTQGRPGFLTRVGEFLGVIEPEEPVEITFEDAGPDGVASEFRALEIELPALEPGDYTLHLQLDLPGREPSITSRPIVVEAAGSSGGA